MTHGTWQVYMNGMLGDPVCSDVVKDGNYAATLGIEVAIAEEPMSEDAMARWLILNGPLSVALDAIGMDYYSGGIDMGEVRTAVPFVWCVRSYKHTYVSAILCPRVSY